MIKWGKIMVKCPKCGYLVIDNEKFCKNCGSEIIREEEGAIDAASKNICPKCGEEIDERMKFCKNCGSEIIREEGAIDATSKNICPNCGEEVEDGMKFCRNCGSKISLEQDKVNQTKFCSNCGFEMDINMKFCPECGVSTDGQLTHNNSQVVFNSNKSPALAAILSFLIIGLGQVYLGLTKKGIILFILAIVSGILTAIFIGFILWLLVWIYAIYDGYNSANKLNNGVAVDDKLDFNNLF